MVAVLICRYPLYEDYLPTSTPGTVNIYSLLGPHRVTILVFRRWGLETTSPVHLYGSRMKLSSKLVATQVMAIGKSFRGRAEDVPGRVLGEDAID